MDRERLVTTRSGDRTIARDLQSISVTVVDDTRHICSRCDLTANVLESVLNELRLLGWRQGRQWFVVQKKIDKSSLTLRLHQERVDGGTGRSNEGRNDLDIPAECRIGGISRTGDDQGFPGLLKGEELCMQPPEEGYGIDFLGFR